MSKYLEAAEAAKNLNKMVRGVLLVGEILERIGALESEEQQAQQRLEKTRNGLSIAKSELKAAQADVEKARGDAQATRDAGELEAKRLVEEAKSQAASVVASAQAEAKRVTDSAAGASTRMRSEAAALMEQARRAVEGGQKLREDMEHEISARQVELVALEKKLADVKAEAARIFGIKG